MRTAKEKKSHAMTTILDMPAKEKKRFFYLGKNIPISECDLCTDTYAIFFIYFYNFSQKTTIKHSHYCVNIHIGAARLTENFCRSEFFLGTESWHQEYVKNPGSFAY